MPERSRTWVHRPTRAFRRAALLVLLIVSAIPAPAQVFDLQLKRVPMSELHGLARFHPGDDPHWADPNFDDSQWPLLRLDQPWSQQGYKIDSGFAWYRFQIIVPAGHPHLGLYAPAPSDSYEIFVDGRLVARQGGLSPKEMELNPSGEWIDRADGVDPVYPIADDLIPPGRPIQIALRLWHLPYNTFLTAGLRSPLVIGDAQLLETQRGLRIDANLRGVSGWNFLFAACLVAFLAGMGLFLLRPGEFEYLWFAFTELGLAALALNFGYTSAHAMEYRAYETWNALAYLTFNTCWPTFVVTFLGEPRRALYWVTVTFGALAPLSYVLFIFQWIPAAAFILVVYLLYLPALTGALLLIWFPARRGIVDARLLLIPQAVNVCAGLFEGVIYVFQTTGHFSRALLWRDRYNSLLSWPFTFSVESLAGSLFLFAILAILVLRFARTSRDEERHANELESARTVQQILVPSERTSIPGFGIESVYSPAGEVGGDFYQIVATANGGALIVIGDVSGKGMPAAMTVSLLVGTFRTLAHYTQNPGEILRAMNQRMCGRNSGGFTTCLVLRADPDGTLTVANAAHLAPYRNGEEMLLESGLPLGIAPDVTYAESTIQLAHNDRLTFLSDGVVEAQSTTGELFGFDRTRSISTQSAEKIAAAAQAFGQEDDITVLTLTFAPAGVLHA
jgi:Stage II sporulation protein E (SpoIIE)